MNYKPFHFLQVLDERWGAGGCGHQVDVVFGIYELGLASQRDGRLRSRHVYFASNKTPNSLLIK